MNAQDRPFITVWNTAIEGTVNDKELVIPIDLDGKYTYNYTIDWGDGTIETNQKETAKHIYAVGGIYTVKISETFPHLQFLLNDAGEPAKLLKVSQWGDIMWKSMQGAFTGCKNMTISAKDTPNLNQVKDMEYMFQGAAVMNAPIGNWDVSNVEGMYQLFKDASSFNQNINDWNVSKVSTMSRMFSGAKAFNQPIGKWDTSKVRGMTEMFANAIAFNQDINNWDINTENLTQVFLSAHAFNQDLSGWDVSNVRTMDGLFSDARSFNQDLSAWDVSNVSRFNDIFDSAIRFNQNLGAWSLKSIFTQETGEPARGMARMLDYTNISIENYDATLSAWLKNGAPKNVLLNVEGLTYYESDADRATLINDYGWDIIGDTKGVKVEFIDFDNKPIKTKYTAKGGTIEPPIEPTRIDYNFTGWDKALTTINKNRVVKAQYIALGSTEYTVNFIDWDGTVLKTEKIRENNRANSPTGLMREGHEFSGWSTDFSIVKEDLTIKALYEINQFRITFFGHNDALLQTLLISYGTDVSAPTLPSVPNHRFVAWVLPTGSLANFDNIRSDEVFFAKYALEGTATYEVSFLDWDMTLINMQLVNENDDALLPADPERTGFDFNGWDKETTAITSDLTIIAQYKDATLGIDTNYAETNTKIVVYPNPVSEFLTIANLPKNSSTPSWRLYDIAGQLIKTGTTTTVNLQGMDQGLYILNIDNSVNIKVVKE